MKNQLLRTELILSLKNPNRIIDLDKAYEQFVSKLYSYLKNSTDLATTYFTISHTKIEVASLLNDEKKQQS